MNSIPQPFDGLNNGVPYQSVASLEWGENFSETKPNSNVITITVPLDLKRRKVYAWLYVKNGIITPNDWFADCRLNFFKGTSPMGFLPLRVGNSNGNSNTVVPNSLVSAFTTQGTANADSLGVYVGSQNGAEPNSLSLQPLYIFGEFDRIVLECKEVKAITYFRTFLACISSQ